MNRQEAIQGLKTIDFNCVDNDTLKEMVKAYCINQTTSCDGCPFLKMVHCRTIDT